MQKHKQLTVPGVSVCVSLSWSEVGANYNVSIDEKFTRLAIVRPKRLSTNQADRRSQTRETPIVHRLRGQIMWRSYGNEYTSVNIATRGTYANDFHQAIVNKKKPKQIGRLIESAWIGGAAQGDESACIITQSYNIQSYLWRLIRENT